MAGSTLSRHAYACTCMCTCKHACMCVEGVFLSYGKCYRMTCIGNLPVQHFIWGIQNDNTFDQREEKYKDFIGSPVTCNTISKI